MNWLLCILLLFLTTIAKTQSWSRFINDADESQVATFIASTKDSGSVVVYSIAESSNNTFEVNDIAGIGVKKLDKHGNIQFRRTITSELGKPLFWYEHKIAETTTGDFVIAAQVRLGNTRGVSLICLDPTLTIIRWTKHINHGITHFSTMKLSKDNEIYLGYYLTTSKFGITAVSSDGRVMWSNSYRTQSLYNSQPEITITEKGEIIAAGTFNEAPANVFYGMYIVKIDREGSTVWAKHYYDSITTESVNVFDIAETSKGELLVTGSTKQKVFLLKASANGELLWHKTYSNKGGTGIGITVIDAAGPYKIVCTTNNLSLVTVNEDGGVISQSEIQGTIGYYAAHGIKDRMNNLLLISLNMLLVKSEAGGSLPCFSNVPLAAENVPMVARDKIVNTVAGSKITEVQFSLQEKPFIENGFTCCPSRIAAGKYSVCQGEPLTLSVPFGSNVTWSTGDTGRVLSLLPMVNQVITVKTELNCGVIIDTIIIDVKKPPVKPEVADATICEGETVSIKTSAENPHWYSDSGTTNLISTSSEVVHAFPQSGMYHYYVRDERNGCFSLTEEVTVRVKNKPSAAFTCSDTYGAVPFYMETSNISEPAEYQWTYDGNSSTMEDISHTFTRFGTFRVTLVASEGDCSDTATQEVNVVDLYDVYIPNVFTPNSDKENEEFKIRTEGVKDGIAVIYNRWGEAVSVLKFPDLNWNGEGCTEGTYFLDFQFTTFGGKQVARKQSVTLLR